MDGLRRVNRALRVHRNVARLLSHATYRQIVLALRELVANAADANSPRVDIDFKIPETPKNGQVHEGGSLSVLDYGDGMDKVQFEQYYLTVGSTTKRGSQINSKGRRIIGRFGVGFLSVIPFADEVTIETRRKGSSMVHGATLVRANIMEELEESEGPEENEFTIDGWDRSARGDDPTSFTRISLKHLTPLAHETLDAALDHYGFRFYKDREKPITAQEKERFLRVWLARVLPLGYQVHGKSSELDRETELPEGLYDLLKGFLPNDYSPVQVNFNGEPLRRAIAGEPVDVREIQFEGKHGIRASGLLWSPRKMVDPKIMRGVAVRVADMAIGWPDDLGVKEGGRQYGLLEHITGEIHVTGAEDEISITRTEFTPGAGIQEFRHFMQRQIIDFETALRKPGDVMRKARRFKKSVQASTPQKTIKPKVASVVSAESRLQELVSQAEQAGISVSKSNSSELIIPKGEREIQVGSDYAAELGRVSIMGSKLRVKVLRETGEPANADELLESALDSKTGELNIAGPSKLFAEDEWAMANVRILGIIACMVKNGTISKTAATELLTNLEESYEE